MAIVDVNILAVIVAAIINMIIGMIWYSPFIFGKKWMKASGKKMKDMKGAGKAHVIMFIASIVAAYVLAYVVKYAGSTTIIDGALTGLIVWIGFIATSTAAIYLFEGRPKALYFMYNGYQLISFIVMGALLAVWV